MAKYNKKIVDKICSMMSTDSYTIAEICEKVKISERTYYNWQSKNADFADAIKKAQDKFDELLVVEAKKSLVKMIQGYTVDETRTVTTDTGKKDDNGKAIVKVKEHVVTKKHYQPNPTLVIFTLTNRDSDNWKNRQENKLSGEVGIKSSLEALSNEELQNIVDGKTE
uniref:phBC6A51 family helix-turn-helix protein n=1 Tax=uncultured Dysgonomonas sp. TaxID=206096 RepID=UPI002619C51D|nr:phBC6A51 family helix-turn-helix protein [uncultured Dysgonomonas sp.]